MTAPKPRHLLLASAGLGAIGLVSFATLPLALAEQRLDPMARAETLRGASVVDARGEELGSIVDMVHLGSDGVRFAVLSTRGAPGLGEGLYPIPVGALRAANGAVAAGPTPVRDVDPADRWPGEPEPSGLLGLRAEDLVGRDVYGETGEPVARIEDVVVLDDGGGVYLVLGVGGFLGLADEEVALPIERFELRIDDVVLTRPITEDELEAMAPYRPEKGESVPPEQTIAEVMAVIGEPGITAAGAGPADRLDGDDLLILDLDRERLSRAPRLAEGGVPVTDESRWQERILTFYQNLLPAGAAPDITRSGAAGSSPSNQ